MTFIFKACNFAKIISSSYNYVFQYKDLPIAIGMGNVRLSYSDLDLNGAIDPSEIIEESNYYPFGLEHQGYNNVVNGTHHPYGFGGKEEQEELGLDWLDFSARNYDPALGRWMNVDPMADHPKQIDTSPYAYVANNPMRYTDPTGMIWEDEDEAEELKKSICRIRDKQQNDIDRIQNKIDNKNLSEKAIARKQKRLNNKQGRVNEMDKSIEDIDFLGESEFTFRLADGGDLNHVTQGEDGVINIQGSNDAIHIHEIRHVSLALNSKEGMQFSNRYLRPTQGIGLLDEMEGYKAQYAFRPGSLPFSVRNIEDFNHSSTFNQVQMTKKIGSLKQNGKPIYKQINLLHLQHQKSGFYKQNGL